MPSILFDVDVPIGLRAGLPGHDAITAFEMGWNRLENGKLMTAAEAEDFAIMVTTDPNIRYQQNLAGRTLALVVLPTNHWPTDAAPTTPGAYPGVRSGAQPSPSNCSTSRAKQLAPIGSRSSLKS
jgi:hypothetical protein